MKKDDNLPRFRGHACYLLIQHIHILIPLIPKKPKTNIIKNFQTYYKYKSYLIKISNFKIIQLCPKIVIDLLTPLNNFNASLKLNTQIGPWYELNNKSFKKNKKYGNSCIKKN